MLRSDNWKLVPSPSWAGLRDGRGCLAAARPAAVAHTRRTVRASASLWVSSNASELAGRRSNVGVARNPSSSFSLNASELGGLPRGSPDTTTTTRSSALEPVAVATRRASPYL